MEKTLVSSKNIVKNLKKRQKQEQRVNITFRINSGTIDSFREKCAREKVSMASVIALLMKEFVEFDR